MLGASEVTGEETDPLRRRLRNVIEEMALASGLPVPDVFVLEKEPGINAFAAGLTHGDAAIAVTRGALERLDRAELQGVVAHEFSHILNGDMRTQPAADRLELRHSRAVACGTMAAAQRTLRPPRAQQRRHCRRARLGRRIGLDRLDRRAALAADQGRRLAAARAARGCFRRAIHTRAERARRRVEKDRRLYRPLVVGRRRRDRAHAVRARRARVQRLVRHASAVAHAHSCARTGIRSQGLPARHRAATLAHRLRRGRAAAARRNDGSGTCGGSRAHGPKRISECRRRPARVIADGALSGVPRARIEFPADLGHGARAG